MKLIQEYSGLKREMYVLFWGRIVTSMGALIWPLMTLIMKNKLGMSASAIAFYFLIVSIAQIPVSLIGGKLADRYNKKHIIVIADIVSIVCYLLGGILPLSNTLIVLLFIGSMAAVMEGPTYDALIADLTSTEEREKAYSLNYMGMNLGLVLSPIIGGILFKDHLGLCFIIAAVATASSTVLIGLQVKEIKRPVSEEERNVYEEESSVSVLSLILGNRVILFYILLTSVFEFIYSMFNYLIPLNLEAIYGENGAAVYGSLTSVNAVIVMIFTPIVTAYFTKMKDLAKYAVGRALMVASLAIFIFIQDAMMLSYVIMVIFTFGEVFSTIGSSPYYSKRMPASHRGRISSVAGVIATLVYTGLQLCVGLMVDRLSYPLVWGIIAVLGAAAMMFMGVLLRADRKRYPLLYKKDAEG